MVTYKKPNCQINQYLVQKTEWPYHILVLETVQALLSIGNRDTIGSSVSEIGKGIPGKGHMAN